MLAVKLYLNHCTAVEAAVETILTAAKASKQQLAAAAHDARECCQAVAEAAAARWSKLLSSRARSSSVEAGGGSGVRLFELQGVLELTDALASLVEQYGVRGVLGLRSALQQLCKASLDGMHSKALSKLTSEKCVQGTGMQQQQRQQHQGALLTPVHPLSSSRCQFFFAIPACPLTGHAASWLFLCSPAGPGAVDGCGGGAAIPGDRGTAGAVGGWRRGGGRRGSSRGRC